MDNFNLDQFVYQMAVWALPVLFAITFHEVAHGWAAFKLGDTTAKMLGRLSLNPLRHIDPIGTVAVPLILLVIQAPFLFGWAKPVPVNTHNLKHYRRDMTLVAIAGPMANLAMAVVWALLVLLFAHLVSDENVASGLVEMGYNGILINLILMAFNLLPIPPLDGGRVLAGLTPPKVSGMLDRIEPYGMIIVVVLVATGVLNYIIGPVVNGGMRILTNLFF